MTEETSRELVPVRVREVGTSALDVLTYGPGWLVRHAAPAWIGARVLLGKWARWVTCEEPGVGYAPVLRTNAQRAIPVESDDPESWVEAFALAKRFKTGERVPSSAPDRLYHHRRARKLLTIFYVAVVVAGVYTAGMFTTDWPVQAWAGYWWAAYVLFLIFTAICYCVGLWHVEEDRDAPYAPVTPLAEGTPGHVVAAGVETLLLAEGHEDPPPRVLRTIDIGDGCGWWFLVFTTSEITEPQVRSVERHMHAAPDALKAIASERSSETWLRVLRRDPLDTFTPCPEFAPNSLDVMDELPFATSEDGGTTGEVFAHANVLVSGRTRSGKSRLACALVTTLGACRNEELDLIDVTDSPDLHASARTFRKIGSSHAQAREILAEALELAQRRSRRITHGIETARPGDNPPQNHTPTPLEPQRHVVIEEYPTFRARFPDLVEMVESIEMIGLKAAVGMILLTQSATKANGLGSTILQAQSTIKICCSISAAEIQYALGQGAKEQGYRPDLLQPAQKGNPRDAGKFFIISGSHTTPMLHRTYGITAQDQITRSYAYAEAEGAEPDVIDAAVLPWLLGELDVLFRETGSDRLPTAVVLDHLAAAAPDDWSGRDPRRLSDELNALGMGRAHQLGPVRIPGYAPFTNPRGYRREEWRLAVLGFEGDGPARWDDETSDDQE